MHLLEPHAEGFRCCLGDGLHHQLYWLKQLAESSTISKSAILCGLQDTSHLCPNNKWLTPDWTWWHGSIGHLNMQTYSYVSWTIKHAMFTLSCSEQFQWTSCVGFTRQVVTCCMRRVVVGTVTVTVVPSKDLGGDCYLGSVQLVTWSDRFSDLIICFTPSAHTTSPGMTLDASCYNSLAIALFIFKNWLLKTMVLTITTTRSRVWAGAVASDWHRVRCLGSASKI